MLYFVEGTKFYLVFFSVVANFLGVKILCLQVFWISYVLGVFVVIYNALGVVVFL